MKFNYYNKVGIDNYYDKSLTEKINLLIKSGAFFVYESDWDKFVSVINFLQSENYFFEEDDDTKIAGLPYLNVNTTVLYEISQIVIKELRGLRSKDLDEELIDEYRARLISAIDKEHRKDIVNEYIKKITTLISSSFKFGYSYLFNAVEGLNHDEIYKKIDFFYNDFIGQINFYEDSFYTGISSEDEEITDELHKVFIDLKKDIISHLAPGGGTKGCGKGGHVDERHFHPAVTYRTALEFIVLHQAIDTLEFFKNELIKLKHSEITKKGAGGSNFSWENVVNNENRFPKVFKTAYNCELFLYSMTFNSIDEKIIFSYYFELFKNENFFRKNVKPSDYLEFVNKVYGLNEVRVRKKLSTDIYNNYYLLLTRHKKQFSSKVYKSNNNAV